MLLNLAAVLVPDLQFRYVQVSKELQMRSKNLVGWLLILDFHFLFYNLLFAIFCFCSPFFVVQKEPEGGIW